MVFTSDILAALVFTVMTAGFVFLLSASYYAKRADLKKHTKLADTAVILGSASFIWMGFSLISNFSALFTSSFNGLLISSHVITGSIALFTGIFFVLDEIKKTRNSMRAVFLLWSLAMFSGASMYVIHYFN